MNGFMQLLSQHEAAPLKDFDREFFRVYEGCMPIEVMAKRGEDTIRFGPLKPIGRGIRGPGIVPGGGAAAKGKCGIYTL